MQNEANECVTFDLATDGERWTNQCARCKEVQKLVGHYRQHGECEAIQKNTLYLEKKKTVIVETTHTDCISMDDNSFLGSLCEW